jgi:hypothetical protein
MKNSTLLDVSRLAIVLSSALFIPACSTANAGTPDPVATHLQLFDQLDFEAFSKKNWDLFAEIHCDDVVVTDSQGNHTEGIDAHLQAMQYVVSFAPDVAVLEHPIKIGQGDYTAVTGRTHMTFSEPMQLPDGQQLQPTGMVAEGTMVTVAKWRGNCIAEEQLFYADSAVTNKQLGLSQ